MLCPKQYNHSFKASSFVPGHVTRSLQNSSVNFPLTAMLIAVRLPACSTLRNNPPESPSPCLPKEDELPIGIKTVI